MLHNLRSHRLAEFGRDAQTLLDRRSQLDREANDVERALSITPKDEGISEFLTRLRTATERMTTLNDEAKQLDRVMAERKADLEARKAKLQAISEREAKEEFTQDDQQRMARMAAKTRVVMKEFPAIPGRLTVIHLIAPILTSRP